MKINVGTAGWTIPRQYADAFRGDGTSLERYTARFSVVEVNSSFHRQHRRATWERWRDSVPADFRFSAKLPKTITHHAKLRDCSDILSQFLEEIGGLGEKLGVLLMQLPPKLEFDQPVAEVFVAELRRRSAAQLACEPRNLTWFTSEADAFLSANGIARVAADPAICEAAGQPGGSRSLTYVRLHGSPVMYRSSYLERIGSISDDVVSFAAPSDALWCIFDNTASSAATGDALEFAKAVGIHAPTQ